jgi:hypothetical protein
MALARPTPKTGSWTYEECWRHPTTGNELALLRPDNPTVPAAFQG